MRVAVLCVVLSFVALVYSQFPAPCTSPAVWESKFFQRFRGARRAEDVGRFYYDENNQRTAMYVEVENSEGEKDMFIDIELYESRTRYFTDRDKGTCVKEELRDDFRPVRIPQNATFNGEFFLGSSSILGAGVQVESWDGNTTNPDGSYEILVTFRGCVPVNDFFFDDDKGELVETFFFDAVLGIDDPDVFIPPEECK